MYSGLTCAYFGMHDCQPLELVFVDIYKSVTASGLVIPISDQLTDRSEETTLPRLSPQSPPKYHFKSGPGLGQDFPWSPPPPPSPNLTGLPASDVQTLVPLIHCRFQLPPSDPGNSSASPAARQLKPAFALRPLFIKPPSTISFTATILHSLASFTPPIYHQSTSKIPNISSSCPAGRF